MTEEKYEVRSKEVQRLSPDSLSEYCGKWIPVEEFLPPNRSGDFLGIIEWEENIEGCFHPSKLVLENYTPTRPIFRKCDNVYWNELADRWQALSHGKEWVKVVAWMPIPKIDQIEENS